MKIFCKYYLLVLLSLYLVSCKHYKSISTTTESSFTKTESGSSSVKKKYAEKLAVPETKITNEKLYKFINDWYAVPYKYGGKDKNGIDCSGLASTLYMNVYKKNISPSTKALIQEVKKINSSDLKEGDLVFFKIESKNVSHVGVYLQNNKFVHASTKKGVIINDLNEPYYKKHFYSSGRVK